MYVASGPDKIWYDNTGTEDYFQVSGNSEMGTGYTPILGRFWGDGLPVDIFWYKAGSAPENLFYS